MKCSQAHKRINEYIDGLLDASETRQLEAHLNICEDCSNLLAEMGTLVKKAQHLETLQPSNEVWRAIKKELVQKDRKTQGKLTSMGAVFNFLEWLTDSGWKAVRRWL